MDAPTDLVEEIKTAIFEASGITTVAGKNSLPDTSSGQVEDGVTSNTTAPSAEPPDCGKTETAQSTSPSS